MTFEEILEDARMIRDSKGRVHGRRPQPDFLAAAKLCVENDIPDWLSKLRKATWNVRAFA